MRLVSQEDFDKAKSREPVHIYCDYCEEMLMGSGVTRPE
jgi:aspartate carbamoyltransferase regulatory subunit